MKSLLNFSWRLAVATLPTMVTVASLLMFRSPNTGVVVSPSVRVLPTHIPYSLPRAKVPPRPVPSQMLSHWGLRLGQNSMKLNCTPSFTLWVLIT